MGAVQGGEPVELRQLKYFLAVADSHSFVSAANNLYISRQAVSKAISQLEAELQVELFLREPTGAYLTPAGIVFYERVRGTVLELDQLQSEIQQYNSQFHQLIRVAFSIGTLTLYEEKIQEFIRRQAHIVVQYFECPPEECEALLQNHKADLVITSKVLTGSALESRVVYEAPYGVLVKDEPTLEVLDSLEANDLKWLPIGCFADSQLTGLCQSLGLVPLYTGIDLLRLISVAASGQCATILPRCMLPVALPGVRWIPLETQQRWQVRGAYLQSLERNVLSSLALDELLMEVFDLEPV